MFEPWWSNLTNKSNSSFLTYHRICKYQDGCR